MYFWDKVVYMMAFLGTRTYRWHFWDLDVCQRHFLDYLILYWRYNNLASGCNIVKNLRIKRPSVSILVEELNNLIFWCNNLFKYLLFWLTVARRVFFFTISICHHIAIPWILPIILNLIFKNCVAHLICAIGLDFVFTFLNLNRNIIFSTW